MSNFQEKINNICKDEDIIGLVCIQTNQTSIINEATYGLSKKPNTLMTLDTIFRIASVSKVIIALGIMKLVEEKKLDIYEDVSLYLGFPLRNPKYPNHKITLEMIMTQTSSLSDASCNKTGYDYVNGPKMAVNLQDLLTNPNYKYYNPKTFSDNIPGTVWEYSNLGCGVLACIIEKITNKFFNDYLKEIIFTPLNLDASFCFSDILHKDKVANLYYYNNNSNTFKLARSTKMFTKLQFPRYLLGNNFRAPAGGLFISALDLAKIMLMLINKGKYENKILFKEETINKMKEIHWQGESDSPLYHKKGLQLIIIDNLTSEPLYGHFGNAYGLYSYMLFNDHYGYIAITNGLNYKLDPVGMSTLQAKTLGLVNE